MKHLTVLDAILVGIVLIWLGIGGKRLGWTISALMGGPVGGHREEEIDEPERIPTPGR
jgi:hypothetical protein